MRTPLAFLSVDTEHDEEARSAFIAQLAGNDVVAVEHWSTPQGFPRADWTDLVRTNISRCDLMIVIVGDKSSASDGMRNEIGFAKRANVPFFGVYASGVSADVTLPEGLVPNRTTRWEWPEINAAVKQLMKEGKHHPHQ